VEPEHRDPPRRVVIISGLRLRRAVLGILLDARGPMAVHDVVRALARAGVTTDPRLVRDPGRVVSDLLSYQARLGRVRRVAHGAYEALAERISPAMRSRARHWARGLDHRDG